MPLKLVSFPALAGQLRQCKKAMSQGDLTEEACILRLKRWLVAGLQDREWSNKKREHHVSMGGVQLRDFAEGMTSQELDDAVSHCG